MTAHDTSGRPSAVQGSTTPAAVVSAGVCVPGAATVERFWDALCAANVPAAPVTLPLLGVDILADRVDDACVAPGLDPHDRRRLDRAHLLAYSAADDAVRAGPFLDADEARRAICVGSGYGPGEFADAQHTILRERGLRRVSPLSMVLSMSNSVSAHLALRYTARGPVCTYATACASGATAIGEALWLLRTGRADVVLAGGVDALITTSAAGSFHRLGAMSSRLDDPATAMRPFDPDRDGFVLGEGAAFVTLMRAGDAAAAGVTPLGFVHGTASNCDAHHVVAPAPDGRFAAACVRDALADAGVTPDDIGHVNAHGTSTKLNDETESKVLRDVFGSPPPVTSSKPVTGHMIGGSGAAEVVAAILASAHGLIPPTGGTQRVDASFGVDVVVGAPRVCARGSLAVSNSFAFGGHNVALVVSGRPPS